MVFPSSPTHGGLPLRAGLPCFVGFLGVLGVVGGVVGASGLAGCSRERAEPDETDDRRQETTRDPAPIPLAEFSSSLVRSFCEYHLNCVEGDSEARAQLQDLSTCQTMMMPTLLRRTPFPDLMKAIEAGNISYDAAAAGRCFAANACVPLLFGSRGLLDVCPEVINGTLMEGDICWRSEECAGDAYCDHGDVLRPGHYYASCPGTCRAPVPIGGVCGSGEHEERCADPPGRDFGTCDNGICVRRSIDPGAPEGAECGVVIDPDGSDRYLGWCGEGLWCASGTCLRDRLPMNSPCDSYDDHCSGHQICDTEEGRCRDVKIAQENEPCGFVDGSLVGLCNSLAFWCVNGRCQRPGDGSLGAPCDDAILTTCNEGAQCSVERVCTRLKQVGESCTYGHECESGGCNGRCEDGECSGRCLPRICSS